MFDSHYRGEKRMYDYYPHCFGPCLGNMSAQMLLIIVLCLYSIPIRIYS